MTNDHLRLVSESDSGAGSESDSEVASNERTNERTNEADSYGCRSGNGSRRGRAYEEFSTEPGFIADVMHEFLDRLEAKALGERWAVSRVGAREEIPTHLRAAVWFRDHGKCADCHPDHPSGDILHLDHIKPWSAGGTDTTDNLRLLCERHNLERSNFVDMARPKRSATWWCHRCYSLDDHQWTYLNGGFIDCPTHGSPFNPQQNPCRVGRAYAAAWAKDGAYPTWHQRPMLTSFERIAYCAHCDAPGMTSVVL